MYYDDTCKPITSDETPWRYYPPPDTRRKVFLLTVGRVAIPGPWGTGVGVIAWVPIPKRDKQKEIELGLLDG